MCRSVEDIVTVHSVFLAQWSLWVQYHLLDAALQCFSEVAPGSISFCLLPQATIPFVFRGHCISCLVGFSLAGFAAKASVPIGDLDPTAMIWTDASLGLEGHGTFWKLGLLLGLWGSF